MSLSFCSNSAVRAVISAGLSKLQLQTLQESSQLHDQISLLHVPCLHLTPSSTSNYLRMMMNPNAS